MMSDSEDEGCSNLPPWEGASAVYSKAYRHMENHGPDHALIDALNSGDEETIKANMLRINETTLRSRHDRQTKRV